MENKWVIFVMLIWIVAMILGASYDKVDIGAYTPGGTGTDSAVTTLNYLTTFKNISYIPNSTGSWTFVGINTEYFTKLWQVMTFDYAFMQGSGYDIVRWVVFYPITIGMMFAIAQLFFQAIQGLLSAIIPG